ncbi:MAG: FAD-linked oxidase C-terminal domain-containing protein [Chloroflexota bacterium]
MTIASSPISLYPNTAQLKKADMGHLPSEGRELVSELKRVVEGDVRFDGYTRMLYSTDASLYQIQPVGVVLPKTADDVQATMEIAHRHKIPVLPRGGGSSLAGQTVGAAIVIDFSKYMNQVLGVDKEAQTATVQPGINFAALNSSLSQHGLMIGPDPASANRATIGGSIGNNATGSHSILYGMMADNVLETAVVLADASQTRFGPVDVDSLVARGRSDSLEGQIYREIPNIIHGIMEEILERWPKHWRRASGYNLDRLAAALLPPGERGKLSFDSKFRPPISDPTLIEQFNLAQLMTGSEGTLATMTEATVKLTAKPTHTGLVILQFDDVVESCAKIPDILETNPSASELLDKQLMDLARAQPEWAKRLHFVDGDPAALLLTEFYGKDEADLKRQMDHLEDHMRGRGFNGSIRHVLDPKQQNEVWDVRKAGLNLLMGTRSTHKPVAGIEDVSVPQEQLAEYLERILSFCRSQDDIPDVAVYAHASAGCLHVRPLLNVKTESGVNLLKVVGEYAADLAVEYRGVMSGEHGDGLARSSLNETIFGPTLYEALRKVKQTFDPENLMNPGKIVDAPATTDNLRMGPTYQTISLDTVFDWGTDGGYAPAIEMCNGAGVCRKLNSGSMCPSYMATREEQDSTRGRANALRNAMAGRIPEDELFSKEMYGVMDLCLGCKACKSECPSAVDMAKIKAEYLVHYYQHNGLPLFNRMMGLLPTLNELLFKSARPLIPLVNKVLTSDFGRNLVARIGVHPERTLPTYATQTFESWYYGRLQNNLSRDITEIVKENPPSSGFRRLGLTPEDVVGSKDEQPTTNHQPPATSHEKSVILFHDTWANYNEPHVAQAAVRVLEAAGYTVYLADGRKCCGRPLITGGQADKARAWVDHNVALLAPYANQDIPIVGIEPSCILTLRDEYLTLASDKKRAEVLAQKAYTFEEFLGKELEAGRFQALWKEAPGEVLLHGHCHHKAMVGNESTVAALQEAGYAVQVIPSGCCGMAGDFGYGSEHYQVSQMVGEDRLFPAVREADVTTTIVASGTSCRHQIEHFTERKPIHLVEALDAALA